MIRRRGALLEALLAVTLVAGCGSGPVSEVGLASPTPTGVPPSATAAASRSAEPGVASLPPSERPVTPAPTPAGPPPKPGNPTFKLVDSVDKGGGSTEEIYEITWTYPDGLATEFLAYGLTECLRYSKKNDGKPCVVKGMKIPKAALVLIDRVPGDERSMRVTFEGSEIGTAVYPGILLRARNDGGDSIFTIVHSENVCYQCTY